MLSEGQKGEESSTSYGKGGKQSPSFKERMQDPCHYCAVSGRKTGIAKVLMLQNE